MIIINFHLNATYLTNLAGTEEAGHETTCTIMT